MTLELLSPAKNLEFGREAINHGADALYIGAPAFGARAAATNTIDDIDALVRYAHLYRARVFATVNTLLFDNELDDAVAMIRRLYNCGVDALIIQDLGLLECDLPPIELHASTQCHNASVERIKFMESAGFRRVILAREISLEQMRAIRAATSVDLEAFVHGALCVSYSGQCYLSQSLNGRSGNRGCCSQPCRSSYDLLSADGRTLVRDRHLLSLRDFNASAHLQAMVDAGISSFKIEGRLKDLSYVKNITAYYRQLLDSVMEGHQRASSGRCTYTFTPDPDRTFNRGYTDYFLRQRQPMANVATQKSLGKRVGEVVALGRNSLTVSGNEPFANGDGLCYFDADGRLQGFLVNAVQGRVVVPNHMPDLRVGTPLWRNQDQQFERLLQGRSADRRLDLRMRFDATSDGFVLDLSDPDGLSVSHRIAADHQPAAKEAALNSPLIVKQLSKLGDTPFAAVEVIDATAGRYFLPAAVLNQLRRDAVARLVDLRVDRFRPTDCPRVDCGEPYPDTVLDYRANIVNSRAEAFYRRHGVLQTERGLEATGDDEGKALMTTRYCLRYELGACLQHRDGGTHPSPLLEQTLRPSDQLVLLNNGRRFRLEFDCRQCLMRLYKA
ncbi:MAG: U32 family peptidase [Bacteroidales bacterium]|nr:U32 family peptidase [Bacteroidales bacterium]